MSNYKDLTFWQNKKTQKFLDIYREKLKTFFTNIEYDFNGDIIEPTHETTQIRSWLNVNLEEIEEAFGTARHSAKVTHYPAPAVGGPILPLDIFQNLFQLQHYDMTPQDVIDQIDQVKGRYQKDYLASVVRTFNPLFWLGKLFNAVASIPFRFLNSLGLPGSKVEHSSIGRFIKTIITFLLWLITTFVAIWGFLVIVGVIKPTDTLPAVIKRVGL